MSVTKDYHKMVQPNLNWSRDFALLTKNKDKSELCSPICSPIRINSPLSFTCTTSPTRKEKHNQLYDESKERQLRKDLIYNNICDTECTFKPKIFSKRLKCQSQYMAKTQKEN